MAISFSRNPGGTLWNGLSTDTKPLATSGLSPGQLPVTNDLFFETDTQNQYIYANNTWTLYKPFVQFTQSTQPNAVAITYPYSSNGSTVSTGTVLLNAVDITGVTSVSLQNVTNQTVEFQITEDGTNWNDVALRDIGSATPGTYTAGNALVTGKLYAGNIKGLQARILAVTNTVVYALSNVTFGGGSVAGS